MLMYTSLGARFLSAVFTSWPCAWIAAVHGRIREQQLKQIFGDATALPVTCGLILRGQPKNRLFDSSPIALGE